MDKAHREAKAKARAVVEEEFRIKKLKATYGERSSQVVQALSDYEEKLSILKKDPVALQCLHKVTLRVTAEHRKRNELRSTLGGRLLEAITELLGTRKGSYSDVAEKQSEMFSDEMFAGAYHKLVESIMVSNPQRALSSLHTLLVLMQEEHSNRNFSILPPEE